MTTNITIIGSGAMATAMGTILANNSVAKTIMIYGIDPQELADLAKGRNLKYFPASQFMPNFATTNDLSVALAQAHYVLLAIPSPLIANVLAQIQSNLDHSVTIINVAKGFEPTSQKPVHTYIDEQTKYDFNISGVVSILGPSHAEDVIKETYTAISAVGTDINLCYAIQALLTTHYCHISIETDVISAEIGSSYKNILAILSGVLHQAQYSINTIAAILTFGMQEAAYVCQYFGGKISTLLGLTGLGDLITTAFSPLSRNWEFGTQFVLDPVLAQMTTKTVEGLNALKILQAVSELKNLDLVVLHNFAAYLNQKQSLAQMLSNIWAKM